MLRVSVEVPRLLMESAQEWHRKHQSPSGLQHPMDLCRDMPRVLYVLEELGADNRVVARIRNRRHVFDRRDIPHILVPRRNV